MKNNYWHQSVIITGLGLLSSTLALVSAFQRLHHTTDVQNKQINRKFLLAASAVELGISLEHAISIQQDLKR
ncbi:hypothetical protein [Pediococcus cellicola]|uniref:hypothetical protein n=1 Tax=Pediococcus cellicola TaxID=319652 RepID=UPI00070B794B|nr:hypothetical protein [Pediococcus cellicola]GEL15033.1 hypothetical protein PCE01_08350 [Pediococcus cellicola]